MHTCHVCGVTEAQLRKGKRDPQWCAFHAGDKVQIVTKDPFFQVYNGYVGILYGKSQVSGSAIAWPYCPGKVFRSGQMIVKCVFQSSSTQNDGLVNQLNEMWLSPDTLKRIGSCTTEELLTHTEEHVRDIALYNNI